MANYNRVILIGNLTRDPQMSYLPSQTPVVEFGLAVNRKWRSTTGEQREETCFVDCRSYGKAAETFNQYMRKGRPVLVEGRLQFDSWEGKDGQKRSKHRIIVENFQFLSAGAGAPRGEGRAAEPSRQDASHVAPDESPDTPPDEQGADEIPF